MLAYGFPPEGHAGVFRPLRFVRNLPALGWRPTVIAAGGTPFQRHDPDLLTQVPRDVDVIRPVNPGDWWQRLQRRRAEKFQTDATDAGSTNRPTDTAVSANVRPMLRAALRRAESWYYHPDMERSWIAPATAATAEACSNTRAEVIWATGPPWSSFLVAEKASRQTGVPYALDFRTSWTIVPSPFEARRPGWAQKRDQRTLRRLLAGARAVTFFYGAEAECFWRMYRGALDVSRIHVIPNGFDGEVEEFVPSVSDKFTILYTGILADYRYDTFLEALALFKQANPTRSPHVRVKFVGEQEPELFTLIAALGISEMVSTHVPLPHRQMGGLQRDAHVLLMLERKPSCKGVELLAGAKLFNYLKAARPILGALPDGEAARILREVGVSTIADANSAEAISRVIQTLFDAWSADRLTTFLPDRSACERYSARQQTVAMTRALEGLPPMRPFVPGAVDVVPSLLPEFASAGLV
jgi:glycosyltransferase involved in cell wall biosynthesis